MLRGRPGRHILAAGVASETDRERGTEREGRANAGGRDRRRPPRRSVTRLTVGARSSPDDEAAAAAAASSSSELYLFFLQAVQSCRRRRAVSTRVRRLRKVRVARRVCPPSLSARCRRAFNAFFPAVLISRFLRLFVVRAIFSDRIDTSEFVSRPTQNTVSTRCTVCRFNQVYAMPRVEKTPSHCTFSKTHPVNRYLFKSRRSTRCSIKYLSVSTGLG